MKKILKISVVGVLFVVVVALVFLVIQEKSIPIRAEAVPCGLEWGMNEEEVARILGETTEYKRDEEHFLIVYDVDNYQGIDGVDGRVILGIDERDGLVNVSYSFKFEESQGGKMSLDMVKKLRKGLDKAYEQYSLESYVVPEEGLYFNKHYVGKKSLVTLASLSEGDVLLTFRVKEEIE